MFHCMSLNRTILELKFFYIVFFFFGKYSQSYHTGIEIYLNNETKLIAECSQSYHTGIEIMIKDVAKKTADALNRTILELKSQTKIGFGMRSLLSIVPYWN